LSDKLKDVECEVVRLLLIRLPADVQVSLDSKIASDLGLDSASIMDFVMELEETFDISVPLDDATEIETVNDLCRAVEHLLQRSQ